MLSVDRNNSQKNAFTLNILLAGVIVARFSCVALSNIPLMGVGFILLYAIVFIGLFVVSSTRMTKTEVKALCALLIYLFEVVISVVLTNRGLFETQAFNAYILVILFFLYLYIKRQSPAKQKFFVALTLIGYIFTFIYSIIKLVQDPMLSRLAATGRYEYMAADTLGAIGGFDAVYGGLLVFVVLVYLWTMVNNKGLKAFLLIGCSSCALFIVMATYATAIILLVATAALMIFKRDKLSAFLIIVALVLGLFFHSQIGDYIMSWSKTVGYSATFQEKMYQIGYMLKYGESVGTLAGDEGRWARIGWSLKTFSQYPLFGGFTVDGAKIGSHSEIADILGRFGLVGFTAIVIFFVCLYKSIMSDLSTKTGKKILFICTIIYLVMSILDPSLYTQQLLPIFLLIPFAEKWKT